MQFFKRLMSKKHSFSGEILPERPFSAIGDLHGRADLLEQMLAALPSPTEQAVVFVGDYIDRGEHSADVLRRVHAFQKEHGDENVICLVGNHEHMLLNFLEDPVLHGPRWLRYGGLQTLASFGVPMVAQTAPEAEWLAARDALGSVMGQELIRWLYTLPAIWMTGNVAVVHAGADPHRNIAEQDDHVLIWGHKKFDEDDRSDGIWVVHGHTIVDNAIAENGRISVDTGAYATGVLSAALIGPQEVSFVIALPE